MDANVHEIMTVPYFPQAQAKDATAGGVFGLRILKAAEK
jgi:hypothetical protein